MDIYEEIFYEPRWYRWVDGLVVLVIGAVLGILIAQALGLVTSETTTQTIRRTPFLNERTLPGEATSGIRLEEI